MNAADLSLYLVTDAPERYPHGLLAGVEAALAGGVTLVQYRAETGSRRELYETAKALSAFLRPRGIPFLINNHLDLALAVEADGIHVGQNDLPVEVVRRLLGPDRLVGLSITDPAQLAAVDLERVDYLGLGPVFPTVSKDDAAAAMGVEGLARIVAASPLPTVAIGGIDATNATALMQAGVDGVAVVSVLSRSETPDLAAKELSAAIERGRRP